jgi:aspartate/methionine/tyrosine aminotransferase
MLESPLAPYLLWAKTRAPASIDLAGSNLLACSIDDLPGARDAVDVTAANDNGYAPLVEAIAAHYGLDQARVVPGAGCSGANFVAIAALVGPGDDVLVERPAYDPLIGACRLMGARVRHFDRRYEDGYRLDPGAVEAALTPRTRLVIVTSPHNPSGCLVEHAALAAVGELMVPRGWVLVDEVYLDAANLVAGRPATHGSAAHLDGPFLVTSSLTKSYGLAGLKCGWTIASRNNAERLRRTRDLVENAGSAPADRLGAHAFAGLDRLAARATDIVSRNHARARALFDAHGGLSLAAPIQASIAFPRVTAADGDAFADRLLEAEGVAVAPGSFFGEPANVRLSLAGHPDTVAEGLDRIGRFLAAQRG